MVVRRTHLPDERESQWSTPQHAAPQARRGPGEVCVQCVRGGSKSAISRCDVFETLAL